MVVGRHGMGPTHHEQVVRQALWGGTIAAPTQSSTDHPAVVVAVAVREPAGVRERGEPCVDGNIS